VSKLSVENFISLLDDYLDGKLDKSKVKVIQKAINEDVFFKKVLEQHVQARANIRIAGEEELRAKFNNNFTATTKEENSRSKLLKGISLLLLVLVAAAALYFYLDKVNSKAGKNNQVDITNLSVPDLAMLEDPSYDLLRSHSDTLVMSHWRKAVQSFIGKDYTSTLAALGKLEIDSSFTSEHSGKYALMKGVANLKLENYDLAEAALISVSDSNPYQDQAQWYLAMNAYYKGEMPKANERLTDIVNSVNHYRGKEAKLYLLEIMK